MYESDIQGAVTNAITEGEITDLTVAITDNELAVIVKLDDRDAAYTAEEARELAQSIKCVSEQRWGADNSALIEYIHDLADVVDNNITADEVREKWDQDVPTLQRGSTTNP